MENLDCRGLACPQPVIRTKKMIDQGVDELAVRVDNQAAAANVTHFFESQGYEVSASGQGADLMINGRRTKAPSGGVAPAASTSPQDGAEEIKTLVMIGSQRLGSGDDELGLKLMGNYLATLKEMGPALWRLLFINGGVKHTIVGAESLPVLKELEAEGVSILVCGTCLDHFNLLEKKVVGQTTNMLDIVTSLEVADKVITIT